MVSEVSEDDASVLLRELRGISERHSKYRNCQNEKKSRVEPEEDSSANNVFLRQTDENRDLNQYWYSRNTIETLCHAMRESLLKSKGRKVAFLSTPSLFFSLSQEEQENCVIFDYDTSWESCSGYHFYDYNHPTNIKDCLIGTFDLVIIDPPFISMSVWEKYATTARLLLKDNESHIIATTVDENSTLMHSLFGCKPVVFRPLIPHLVYQYSVFTNFSSLVLSAKNPDLQE